MLEKNLAAMGWKATAERIRKAAVPDGYRAVMGSDGTATFAREEQSPRRVEWLGRTSMPRAAAESMVKALDARDVNGMGLGMGTGYEWAAFAGKLGRHQALFVWEPDARMARMALEICDLSELIAAGKLVLFVGEDLGEQLKAFLRENAGYETPTLLHPLPTLVAEERRVLLGQAEPALQASLMEQQSLTEQAARALAEAYAKGATDATVGMWLGAAHGFERPWQREAVAGALTVDAHDQTSLRARMMLMAKHRPSVVVSDVFAGQLLPGELLAAGVRVETYLTADAMPTAPTMRANDRVIVQSACQRAFLLEQGVAGTAIELRRPRVKAVATRVGFGFSVALMGDLPAADAKTLGVELPTHVALYEAAKALIVEDPFAVTPPRLGDLLRRVQHRAGIEIKDEHTRDTLARMLKQVLAPTFTAVGFARLLDEAGVPLTLIGRGWEQAGVARATLRPWPVTADAAETLAGVAVVAGVHWANVLGPLVTAAPAYGVPLLSVDAANETFAQVVKAGQFVAAAKALLADRAKRDTLAAQARQALGIS